MRLRQYSLLYAVCKDDQQTTQKSLSELLSALDSLCLYRVEDWWTYELCYKKHVRQFHKVQRPNLQCTQHVPVHCTQHFRAEISQAPQQHACGSDNLNACMHARHACACTATLMSRQRGSMLQETAVSYCWVALLTSHHRLLQEVEKVISEYDLGQYNDEGSDLDAILDNSTLSGVSSRYVRQVSHCKSSDYHEAQHLP